MTEEKSKQTRVFRIFIGNGFIDLPQDESINFTVQVNVWHAQGFITTNGAYVNMKKVAGIMDLMVNEVNPSEIKFGSKLN